MQVYGHGHGHGHEIKTKKRPWPRFLVSCVALMLILVVSWHFYTVFFFPLCLVFSGAIISFYSIIPTPSSRLSPTRPFVSPLPHLWLSSPEITSPYRKTGTGTGTGLSSAHEDDVWHDLTETLLVRVHTLRDLTIASFFRLGMTGNSLFIFFTGAKLAYDGIPVDMLAGHEPKK